METLWYILLVFMLAGYIIADGFDLGVGMLLPLVARSEDDRAAVRAAIGHVWGANEVWLIAFGGLLFMAFPEAYAVGFSGFYLALMFLLWCLIGRGLSLEVRSHLDQPVWQTACDILLPLASFFVATAIGAAGANILRGVPLDAEGHMFLPLWNNLLVRSGPAIFDWYTILAGLTAVAALTLHGASYLAMKTEGELRRRAEAWAGRSFWATAVLGAAALVATPLLNGRLLENYQDYPFAFVFVALSACALIASPALRRRGRFRDAFLASALFLAGAIACAAFALFPNLLPSTPDPSHSLTVYNTAASTYGLVTALVWFCVGLALIGFYMFYIYRIFGEKVSPGSDKY